VTRAAVKDLYQRGFSQREIAARLGVSKTTVAFHMRRLDVPPDARFARRYDWAEIQRAYDSGLSVRDCAARFGFNLATWYLAVQSAMSSVGQDKRPSRSYWWPARSVADTTSSCA
jgi:transposase-like protein